jgi:hypothetical protein
VPAIWALVGGAADVLSRGELSGVVKKARYRHMTIAIAPENVFASAAAEAF